MRVDGGQGERGKSGGWRRVEKDRSMGQSDRSEQAGSGKAALSAGLPYKGRHPIGWDLRQEEQDGKERQALSGLPSYDPVVLLGNR